MKTSQLEKELENAPFFDERLIEENPCPEFTALIDEQLEEKGVSRSDLIRGIDVDRSYGYQLLNGTRAPTRSHIIRIGLYLGLSPDALNRLLKAGDKKQLYVKDLLDAKVFYALNHAMPYEEAALFVWGNELT